MLALASMSTRRQTQLASKSSGTLAEKSSGEKRPTSWWRPMQTEIWVIRFTDKFVLTNGPYEILITSRATSFRRIKHRCATLLVGGPLILRATRFHMINLIIIARRPSKLHEGSGIVNTCSKRTCYLTGADPKFLVLARLLSLMEVFRLRWSYGFQEWLRSQFMLTFSRAGVDVALSREEVLDILRRKT